MCSGSQLWWKGVVGDGGGRRGVLYRDHVIFAEISSVHNSLRPPHCISTGPSLAVHVNEVHPFTCSFTLFFMETFLPSPIDDDGDATGDREWDSSYLLLAAIVNEDACARLLPPGVSLPPEEVLELGAGTGAMACSLLASRWSGVRYVATDMACRIANIEANAAKSKCTSLYAQPLIWGSTPPAPMSAGDATYLVLMSDLIYFHGKHLLEPDTLEPLAQTLSMALSQRRRSCALFTFRERDPEREAHFRALCVALGLAVTEPLDADYLAGLVPAATHSDVESSGPLRLWRLTPPQDSTTHVISDEAPTPTAPAATVPQHALSSAQPSVLIPQLSITALSAGSVRAHLRIKIGQDLPRSEPDLPRSEPDLPKSEPDLPRSEPDLPRWRQGALVASEREPRLVLYPNFLSESETAHLLDLSRWGALEAEAAAIFTPAATPAVSWDSGRAINAASSGRTITIHLPSPSDDPIIQAIEERCAAATGIPIHAVEEPIGVRLTSPSTATT